MGWSNEQSIEQHNHLMATDGEYHSRFMDWMQERELEGWREPDETEIDWFDHYKLSYCGYEEYEGDDILNAAEIGEPGQSGYDDPPF